MEAAMRNMMAPHTNVRKSCMTKEKFDQSNFISSDQPGTTCKQTITTNTRSALDGTVSCTGQRPSTAQVHIDAPSSTSIKGSVKTSESDQGRTMSVDVAMTGKWLGADCGAVKP
jgi:uncharacterized protein DUF3617